MPRFEVRLEAPDDSGHFRLTRLDAPDADAARDRCQRTEYALAAYQLSDDDAASLLERARAKVKGTGEKGRVTRGDLEAALEKLPKPAALDAPPEEKAEFFEAFQREDRGRLAAHFQAEPYEVVSVTEVKGR